MSADEITQVLSDVEYFDLPIEEAASVAHDMVERQRQAQSEFEDTIPLSTLRENKRRGAGPRSVKKGIAGSSLEKGITRSSLEKGITRSSPTEEKRGSPDPQKEDRVIPQPRGKGDQAIHRKGRFTASGQPKRLSEPPPNHEPTWNHDHDPPPPEAANHVDSGGGGMSETALFGVLPLNRVRELVARKRRSGSRSGGIVNALRALQTQLPLSPAQEHEAQQEHSDRSEAALERRARGIAPSDITELEMQYLLLYLEEGASDDEALQRLQAQRDDEPLMSVEEGM
jgi:hypothetical protein